MIAKSIATVVAVLALVVIVIGQPFYIVPEYQQVVITQFGDPVGEPVTKAGLHYKLPFVQQPNYFEKRLLEWDEEPTQIPTGDKRFILIDETARWRITDPLLFLQSVGTYAIAERRLKSIIGSATRDVVSSHILQEVVRSSNRLIDVERQIGGEYGGEAGIVSEKMDEIQNGREKLTRMILERASALAPKYGIELVDMRIKRINYEERTRQKVYERMIAERKRVAGLYRSEGEGKKAEIEGQIEKDLKRILSESRREALTRMGKADAEATAIYAEAYKKDPGFYAFLKTLETYRAGIDDGTTLILSTDSDVWRLLKKLE